MDNNSTTKNLNHFLKGINMAIALYENFIEKSENHDVKSVLQQIQQDYKSQAVTLSEKIKDLGGVPVSNNGLLDKLVDGFSTIKNSLTINSNNKLVESAYDASNTVYNIVNELIQNKKLPKDSYELLSKFLKQYENHMDILKTTFNKQ